jgi:hypothetical protein
MLAQAGKADEALAGQGGRLLYPSRETARTGFGGKPG